MASSLITLRLQKPIDSAKLSKEDLCRLCEKLEERINSAADLEVNNLARPDNTTAEDFEAIKSNLRAAFQLAVTVKGTDNQELYGTPSDVFNSPNFPENVLTLYANSSSRLQGSLNYTPRNEVEVVIDFSPPAKFDFNTSPGVATKNDSRFVVTGIDATWCNGLFHELERYFESRSNYLPWIHKGDFWNLLFWLIGIPICFWITYRISPFVSAAFGGISQFVLAAAYLYLFLMAAHFLRAIFWYARWIWPKVEYVGGRSNVIAHRVAVISIALGLVSSVLYDIFKSLF